MREHSDWGNLENPKPDGWIKLEYYAHKRSRNSDMTAQDFQRMLEREYHENRAKNLTDASRAISKEYMSKAMEKFKKDLADIEK